jgi:hypothetical protein
MGAALPRTGPDVAARYQALRETFPGHLVPLLDLNEAASHLAVGATAEAEDRLLRAGRALDREAIHPKQDRWRALLESVLRRRRNPAAPDVEPKRSVRTGAAADA